MAAIDFLLATRRARVKLMLGNRADISVLAGGVPSRLDGWLRDTYIDIGMGFNFTQAQIPLTGQIPQATDTVVFPDDARQIDSIMFYRLDGTPIDPEWKDIKTIRQYNATTQGPPSVVALYGTNIYIRPVSDGTYNYILDYWQEPQILDNTAQPGFVSTGPGDLGGTIFNVPMDWLEIIDYQAALRGHSELQEPEKAQALQQLLYGVTIPTTGKVIPGLIATRSGRLQKQLKVADYGIAPKSARQSFTSVKG